MSVQRLFPLEICNSSGTGDKNIPQVAAVPKQTVSPPTESPCASPVAPTIPEWTRSEKSSEVSTWLRSHQGSDLKMAVDRNSRYFAALNSQRHLGKK